MGLLDDLTPPSRYRMKCHYALLKAKLDDADQARLEQMIADPAWSNTGLAKALTSKGLDIGQQSIARHRRQDCSCSKI